MKVNRDNYEIWIIDYLDGRLTSGQVDELMAFFEENPELKEEFESFEPVSLQPEDLRFEQKDRLKKTLIVAVGEINENNYEKFFTGWYENDLSPMQKQEVISFIGKNPHLKKEFDLHGQLILKADNRVVFPGKSQLKKGREITVYRWLTAAAAAMLIFMVVNGLIKRETPIEKQNVEVISEMEVKNVPLPVTISHEFPVVLISRSAVKTPVPEIQESILPHQRQQTLTWLPAHDLNSVELQPLVSPSFYKPDYMMSNELFAYADTKTEKPKRNGLLAKIIRNFTKKLKDKLPENPKEKKGTKEPPMLRVLDNSIMVFNTVTGSDTEVEKIFDDDGNLLGYRIEGENFSWYKKAALQGKPGK